MKKIFVMVVFLVIAVSSAIANDCAEVKDQVTEKQPISPGEIFYNKELITDLGYGPEEVVISYTYLGGTPDALMALQAVSRKSGQSNPENAQITLPLNGNKEATFLVAGVLFNDGKVIPFSNGSCQEHPVELFFKLVDDNGRITVAIK